MVVLFMRCLFPLEDMGVEDPRLAMIGVITKALFVYGWSTNPPGPRTPPEIAGLIKGLLTIGFP